MVLPPVLKTPLLLAALCLATAAAQASQTLAFAGHFEGSTQIIEVIDPALPVLRFATEAVGTGSLGLVGYRSTDVVDMSTGQGSGSNRFSTAAGDELLGSFAVQVLPVSPGVVDLLGTLVFSGGTGLFAGASGAASFVGHGQFISASTALSSFDFTGTVTVVPEPQAAALMLAGLLGGAAWRCRHRRAASRAVQAESAAHDAPEKQDIAHPDRMARG